ncbi:unnamed protein product [Ectocarpus sp. 12 AP-2014]
MMAAARTTAKANRATGFLFTVALAMCSCGGVALGFVVPASSSALTAAAAAKSHRVAAAATAARPRAPSRLYSSKEPTGSGGATDFMDSIGGVGRELSTEEKIAALQKEVQAQAAAVAEAEEKEQDEKEGAGEGEVAIPASMSVESEEEEEESSGGGGFFSKDEEFSAEPGFVDEGKNILWPNTRRAAQLTLLAVVAQIAFIVYIITLNSLLNAFPQYFQKFVDIIKSGDWSQVRLPDL